MKNSLALIPLILLLSCTDLGKQSTSTTTSIPQHQVSESPLGNGKRIEITAAAGLTKDGCLALVKKYESAAGEKGQIVVQKPNPKSPWNGKVLPFCVDNRDGSGAKFDTGFFNEK